MAVEVVWLDQAKDDLREILDFIAKDNPSAAKSYVDGIERASKKLAAFPDSGLVYDSRFRRIVFRNHLIFYNHDPENRTVSIVAIIDGRRDVKHLLPQTD
jgi:toxin ParE1/3/4